MNISNSTIVLKCICCVTLKCSNNIKYVALAIRFCKTVILELLDISDIYPVISIFWDNIKFRTLKFYWYKDKNFNADDIIWQPIRIVYWVGFCSVKFICSIFMFCTCNVTTLLSILTTVFIIMDSIVSSNKKIPNCL